MPAFVYAGGIYKNKLIFVLCKHAHNGIARGLGLWRNYRHLFAHKHVNKRAFACVRPAYHPYKSASQSRVIPNLLNIFSSLVRISGLSSSVIWS